MSEQQVRETPRLVIDEKRQFVKRQRIVNDLNRAEWRIQRRAQSLVRQKDDIENRARHATEAAEDARAAVDETDEAAVRAAKRDEANRAEAAASQLWTDFDAMTKELEAMWDEGETLFDNKVRTVAQFIDAIAYCDDKDEETRRWVRPSNQDRGADDGKFQAEVDVLIEEVDKGQFDKLLERFTGGKVQSPPTSDAR